MYLRNLTVVRNTRPICGHIGMYGYLTLDFGISGLLTSCKIARGWRGNTNASGLFAFSLSKSVMMNENAHIFVGVSRYFPKLSLVFTKVYCPKPDDKFLLSVIVLHRGFHNILQATIAQPQNYESADSGR